MELRMGGRIAALRKSKGMAQEQLAEALGISSPAVSKWETDRSYPDITLLCPLARALDVNVDALLQFEETLTQDRLSKCLEEIIETARNQEMESAEAAGKKEQWKKQERELLHYIHQKGTGQYLQYAVSVLTSMAISEGDFEKAEQLLKELPEQSADPSLGAALHETGRKRQSIGGYRETFIYTGITAAELSHSADGYGN